MTESFRDLGDEFTTCVSCGARMKAGRRHCLRCFQSLQIEASTLPVWRTLKVSDRSGLKVVRIAAIGVFAFAWLLWKGGILGGTRDSLAHASPSPPIAIKPTAVATPVAVGFAPAAAGDGSVTTRQAFEHRLQLDPTNESALVGLGGVLERSGALSEAVDVFHRAAVAAPGSPTPRLRAASIEAHLGRLSVAIVDYQLALRLVPDDYSTHAALAAALQNAGDDRGAIEQFDLALGLAPDAEEAANIRARRDTLVSRDW